MEDRLSAFSSGESMREGDSVRSRGLLEEERMWRGMLAGLLGFWSNGGILSVLWLRWSSPDSGDSGLLLRAAEWPSAVIWV